MATSKSKAGEAGGRGKWQPITDKLKETVIKFQKDAESALGVEHFLSFIPLSYQTQVVAGLKYYVLVQIAQYKIHDVSPTITVELFEDLQGHFHFVGAWINYLTGYKALSHATQHLNYTPADQGPGPVVPPTNPGGPEIPATYSVTVPLRGWAKVDDEVKKIADGQREAAEKLFGRKFALFQPIEYARQQNIGLETLYVAVLTGESKILLHDAPISQSYTELQITHSLLLPNQQYQLVHAIPLPHGLPVNLALPIGIPHPPTQKVGPVLGPFNITTELKDASETYKQEAKQQAFGDATVVGPESYDPLLFYYQLHTHGTDYYVWIQTGAKFDGRGFIKLTLYLPLTPDTSYQFVSAEAKSVRIGDKIGPQ